MKPPAFDYYRPSSLSEAVEVLSDVPGAKALAGGQSLIPLMNFRLARPSALVDLSRVDGLASVAWEGQTLKVGAMTTHRDIEDRQTLKRDIGVFADALPLIGHIGIRNRGTVGGSLAHADPAAEWAAIALLLDASVRAVGPEGSRDVGIEDFFVDWMTTSLHHDELIESVSFHLPEPAAGSALVEVARRHGDFAMAGVGVALERRGDVISSAKVALLGLGLTPKLCRAAGESLVGGSLSDTEISSAAEAVIEAAEPLDDQHASASYKREVAGALTSRAIRKAGGRLD